MSGTFDPPDHSSSDQRSIRQHTYQQRNQHDPGGGGS